jgi:hypothetical protein
MSHEESTLMTSTRRRLAALTTAALLAGSGGAALASTSGSTTQWAGWTSGVKSILWPKGVSPEPAISPTVDQNTYNNLIFHGGVVQHSPKVYLIFWGPAWKTGFKVGPSQQYTQQTAMNYESKFFANVGGSKWAGTQTQYCDGIPVGSVSCSQQSGAKYVTNPTGVLKGTWVDPSPVPPAIVTSGLATNLVLDPIATEAARASQHFKNADPDSLFMVFAQPGTVATAYGSVYCAYHSEITNPMGHGVRYAFMPFTPEQGAGCGGNSVNNSDNAFGNGYFDSYTLAGGHEWAEAVTDPDAFPFQDGWNDYQTSENGDKCAYFHSANIKLGTHTFAVQPLWSNEGNNNTGGCAFSRGSGKEPVPPLTPVG